MTNNIHPFQKRISYQGPIEELLKNLADDYNFGSYESYQIIDVGYEDFNIVLKTNKGKFFFKIFANFRDEEGCQRYIDIILAAIKNKVSHPKLYQSKQGYYHHIKTETGLVRSIALEYIEGKTFYDLKQKPNQEEKDFLVKQAALINQIAIKPEFVYDSWAIINFQEEYHKIKKHLTKEDVELIEPLVRKFTSLPIKDLPHCFVHGDIIETNVIRSEAGKLYLLDFSVSNIYPRIQELAVMLCNILFDSNKDKFNEIFNRTLQIYQNITMLKEIEISTLPLYVQAAHAMHMIGSVKSAVNDGEFEENDYWMKVGREGLKFTFDFWQL